MKSSLALYRKQKNLTQEELAEASGITVRTIQRIENGKVVPQLHTLRTLAECLGTEPENLVEGLPVTAAYPVDLVKPPHLGLLAVIHMVPLIGIYWPFTNVVIPLAFWLLKKEEHFAYNEQGRKIINFQLTVSIATYAAIGTMLVHPVGYALLMGVYGFDMVMACLNGARALKGKKVYYPLAIPFLKNAVPKLATAPDN